VALKLLRPMSLLTPTALAFGAGLLVGSGVTLLTAPRSGAENRAALRRLVRRALRRDKSEALLPAAPKPLDTAD